MITLEDASEFYLLLKEAKLGPIPAGGLIGAGAGGLLGAAANSGAPKKRRARAMIGGAAGGAIMGGLSGVSIGTGLHASTRRASRHAFEVDQLMQAARRVGHQEGQISELERAIRRAGGSTKSLNPKIRDAAQQRASDIGSGKIKVPRKAKRSFSAIYDATDDEPLKKVKRKLAEESKARRTLRAVGNIGGGAVLGAGAGAATLGGAFRLMDERQGRIRGNPHGRLGVKELGNILRAAGRAPYAVARHPRALANPLIGASVGAGALLGAGLGLRRLRKKNKEKKASLRTKALVGAGLGATAGGAHRALTFKSQEEKAKKLIKRLEAIEQHGGGMSKPEKRQLKALSDELRGVHWAQKHPAASTAMAAGTGAVVGAGFASIPDLGKKLHTYLTKVRR